MADDNIFSGLKVVDLASFVAGPGAAVILSDFGADVIKVEPPAGDLWRMAYEVPPQPRAKDNYPWHLALVQGLATAMPPLLAKARDEEAARAQAARADTAIFYSISNCQHGLRGISFGNFLIKQVVEELQAEFPQLKRFSTLSPVPGFRRWFMQRLAEGRDPDAALLPELERDGWWHDLAQSEKLRPALMRRCALYLTQAPSPGSRVDPVARFHLGNGARLERVNWLGNAAPRAIQESFGIMVNYLYDHDSIEDNHDAFVRDGTIVRSPDVDALMQGPGA